MATRLVRIDYGLNSLRFFWLLAVVLITAGCARFQSITTAAPQVSLTRQELISHWQQAAAQAGAAAPAGPLTLKAAIAQALQASPALDEIEQRIAGASAEVLQAEAAFYPSLVLGEQFNVTNNPVYALMDIINQRRLQANVNFNDPGQQHDLSSQIQARWSLFEGGSRWYNREAAIAQRSSVSDELQAARNQLITRVTETYYRWLQALSYIGVAKQALHAAKTDEALGEARYRVEMALPSDIARLKARTAEMTGNLVTARTGARRLQAAMERLLARPIPHREIPNPGLSLTPPSKLALSTSTDTAALVKKALEQRPEIASVCALIKAAQERVRAARGHLLPTLGAGVDYQLDSGNLHSGANSYRVGVMATWPLFQGGITTAQIHAAQAHLREMTAKGRQLALDIALEVQQATLEVQEAAAKIRVAGVRKKWARKALTEVRQQFRNQTINVDTLLQAEVAYNRAAVSYTSALFQGKIAQAGLRQALGDLAAEVS